MYEISYNTGKTYYKLVYAKTEAKLKRNKREVE